MFVKQTVYINIQLQNVKIIIGYRKFNRSQYLYANIPKIPLNSIINCKLEENSRNP